VKLATWHLQTGIKQSKKKALRKALKPQQLIEEIYEHITGQQGNSQHMENTRLILNSEYIVNDKFLVKDQWKDGTLELTEPQTKLNQLPAVLPKAHRLPNFRGVNLTEPHPRNYMVERILLDLRFEWH